VPVRFETARVHEESEGHRESGVHGECGASKPNEPNVPRCAGELSARRAASENRPTKGESEGR